MNYNEQMQKDPLHYLHNKAVKDEERQFNANMLASKVTGESIKIELLEGGLKFFYAYYVSRSFQFDGFGFTQEEAIKALEKAIHRHAEQREIDVDNFYNPDDVNIVEAEMGQGYRDDECITKK